MYAQVPFDQGPPPGFVAYGGLGGVQDAIFSELERQLRASVHSVTVKSALTGSRTMRDPFVVRPRVSATPGAASAKDKFLRWLRPTIVVKTARGQLVMAPWGVAERDHSGAAVVGGVLVLGLAAYGAVALLRRRPTRP